MREAVLETVTVSLVLGRTGAAATASPTVTT
jgi:hypothetical protein